MSDEPSSPPTPPSAIPQYIVDGLDRQDRDTLERIEEYTRELRDHLEEVEDDEIRTSELVDEDEELVDVDDGEDGTRVVKRVPCGKDCGGCPHGPYLYLVRREGDSLEWEYKGSVDEQVTDDQ